MAEQELVIEEAQRGRMLSAIISREMLSLTKQKQTLKQQSWNVIRKSQKYSGRNK